MSAPPISRARQRLGRLPLLAAGMLCLVAGVWGGLVRLQWALPLPRNDASWITYHGPLMVAGFLGTVIGIERAVAVGRGLAFLGPVASALAGLLLVAGGAEATAKGLAAIAAASLTGLSILLWRRQPSLHGGVLGLGAASWLVGQTLWLLEWRIPELVGWWIAFLVLTIAGERIELSRLARPRRWARPLLAAALAVLGGGLVASLPGGAPGERLLGLGLAALAAWLARHDIAWRAAGRGELPRFVATAVGCGYAWLGASGLLLLALPPTLHPIAYDPALHAIFLGFAFAMVFAHAPIIFPAILHVPVPFRRRFYAHLALLQAAVALRFVADLAVWEAGKRWGGALGAIAIALFVLNTGLARWPRVQGPAGGGLSGRE